MNILQQCFQDEKNCRQMDMKNFREVIDNLLQQFQVKINYIFSSSFEDLLQKPFFSNSN